MHGTTSLLLQERLRIYSLFLGTLIVTVIYILANWLIWLFYPCMAPGASDIAGNGIMFASNDQ
jgi:hypothetical protein